MDGFVRVLSPQIPGFAGSDFTGLTLSSIFSSIVKSLRQMTRYNQQGLSKWHEACCQYKYGAKVENP